MFECASSYDQNTVLEAFYQICNVKNQYIQCYKLMSFCYSYQSKLTTVFSMKYISSNTLLEYLTKPNLMINLKPKKILNCIFAVSEGMNYLHENIICHGNLCPSNIIIDEAFQFYICHFGLFPIKNLYMNKNDMFYKEYKDPYMKNDEPSFSSDVYSFGVLICHLLLSYLKIYGFQNLPKLQEFIKNPNIENSDQFSNFCLNLAQKCLNNDVRNRPFFKQIIEMVKTQQYDEDSLRISNYYDKFLNTNYLFNLALKDNTNALIKVGKMYENGINVEKDEKKAMEYYKRAALLNDSEGQNKYGLALQKNYHLNNENLTLGAKYLSMSSEQGNVHGKVNYGLALLKGNGVDKKIYKALSCFKTAADLGYSSGQVEYGKYLINSDNPTPEKTYEGLQFIRKAMNQDDPYAYLTYAYILREKEQNPTLAMKYFKIAADKGNVDAMIEYANGNLNGIGVQKNEEKALLYYQLADNKENEFVTEQIN